MTVRETRSTITPTRETRVAQVVTTDSAEPFGGFTARVLRYGPPADDYGSIWEKGLANEGLAQRMPVLAWAHRWDKPIGRATGWRDEDDGLYIDFVFDDPDAVPLAKQARAQVLSGTLTDVSVGFTRIADTQNEDGTETITKATIDETSIVLRGAVSGAEVVSGSARSAPTIDRAEVRTQVDRLLAGDVDVAEFITELVARTTGAPEDEPRRADLAHLEERAAPMGSMSFYDVMQLVRDAVVDRIEDSTGVEPDYLWMDDAGPDWAVYCINGDFWQVPYSIDDQMVVTLGDAFEVNRQTVYTPVVEPTGTASAEQGEQRGIPDADVEAALHRAARRR